MQRKWKITNMEKFKLQLNEIHVKYNSENGIKTAQEQALNTFIEQKANE